MIKTDNDNDDKDDKDDKASSNIELSTSKSMRT